MTASTPPPTLASTTKRGPDFALVSTYDEIATRAQAVRALLDEIGVRLHPGSALGKMLRDAERVAKDFREGNSLHRADGLIRLGCANRVAAAILKVGRAPGALECLRRMTGGGLDALRAAPVHVTRASRHRRAVPAGHHQHLTRRPWCAASRGGDSLASVVVAVGVMRGRDAGDGQKSETAKNFSRSG